MGVFAWKSYGLVKDKTVPFLPNSGYAFVVIHPAYSLLRSSWHGREAIAVPVERAAPVDPQHLLPRPRAAAERRACEVQQRRAPATLARVSLRASDRREAC